MTRFYRRFLTVIDGRRRATLGAALAAAVLGGCGGPTAGDVNQAVSAAAHAAQAVTRLSRNAVRSWCPPAVADRGRHLTQAQARECLRRAWSTWLSELRRNGYDPRRIAQGP